ncbi:MAG: T9SS type A sorting domain-containing protein, partial [Bacteroidia bacterium]
VNVVVVWPTSPAPIVTDSLKDTLTVILVSIDPKIDAQPGLIVFPNPTRDQLYLSRAADLPPIRRTEIIAADGRLVAEFKGLPKETSVAHLPQGLYLLRIHDDQERVSTHRFVRQ